MAGRSKRLPSSLRLSGDASEGTPITAHLLCFPQKSFECVIAVLCFLSMTWGHSVTWGGGGTRQQEKGETTPAQAGKGGERKMHDGEEINGQKKKERKNIPHVLSHLLCTTSQILTMKMNLKCCYNTPASGRSKWGYSMAQVWLCVSMTVLFKWGRKRQKQGVTLWRETDAMGDCLHWSPINRP